jgi:hypothetical protein
LIPDVPGVLARRTAANVALVFADRYGDIIPDHHDDDDDDEDYIPNDDDEDGDAYDDDDDAYNHWGDDDDPNEHNDAIDIEEHVNIAGVAHENENPIAGVDKENDGNDVVENVNPDGGENAEDNHIGDDEQEDNIEAVANDYNMNAADSAEEADVEEQDRFNEAIADGNNQPDEQLNVDREMDQQRYGEQRGTYDLRARKPRDYGHLHATLEHTVMTQHSMKRGIKEFGEAGVDAVLKELQQLHDRKVLEPVHVSNMTKEEKRASLQYLMFLKRNGTVPLRAEDAPMDENNDYTQPRRRQARQRSLSRRSCYHA